jgi:hypothetical protein
MWDEYIIYPLLGTYCYFADFFLESTDFDQDETKLYSIKQPRDYDYPIFTEEGDSFGWSAVFPISIIFVEPI